MKLIKIHPLSCGLAFALLIAGSACAQTEATLDNFYTPSYRGETGTTSALWDDQSSNANSAAPAAFTSAYGGANTAYYAAPGGGSLASASVTQTTDGGGGTFIIPTVPDGSGDIYSYSAVNTFVLNYAGASAVGNVIFQAETSGSTLDYSSVVLNYTLAGVGEESLSATPVTLYNSAGSFGGFPDSDVVTAYEWNLPTGDDITSFSIDFNGSDTSVGLERTMLDVASFDSDQPVPEPSSLALVGVGGAGLLFWGRRFRQSHC